MTRGLQQQEGPVDLVFRKSAAMPQHGQKAPPEKPLPAREPRSFTPRPGH